MRDQKTCQVACKHWLLLVFQVGFSRRVRELPSVLAETLPALLHDPNRPEDVLKVDVDDDGAGGDDAADTLRYLVATRPREVRVRKLTGL